MDSRSGVRRGPIIVGGPLAPFADGLRRDLAGQGYAPYTITDHVRLFADLSDWLSDGGLVGADLTVPVADAFLLARPCPGRGPTTSNGAPPRAVLLERRLRPNRGWPCR